MTKNNGKIVVQAKRHKNNVGIKAVQEVVSSIAHYKADKDMVITNSYFTDAAIELAKSNNVILYNRDNLLKMIESVGNVKQTVYVKASQNIKTINSCKRCGANWLL